MLKKLHLCAAVLVLCVSSPVFSLPIASGTLGSGDPTFVSPNGVADPAFYDTVEFTVDTSGLYTFDAFYPGVPPANLDGYIFLYANMFNPAAPGDHIALDDDGPGGATTSQILDINLAAGTSYFMVVSSFDDVPTSFGQPTGDWELSGVGAGQITVGAAPPAAAPEPATLWLLSLGIGLVGLRRLRIRVS